MDSIGERCLDEILLEDASSWLARAAAMLGAPQGRLGFTVEGFARACHRARLSEVRVFVYVHMFAGGFSDACLKRSIRDHAAAQGLLVMILGIDFIRDPDWNLLNPITINILDKLEPQGYIDGIGGGPPRATCSALRFLPNGPPRVRVPF